ncbi:MAG: hypothetical protein IJF41_00730 [Clostridia bacterium]|nr:hypothetical protein [Clostridia bacterium]
MKKLFSCLSGVSFLLYALIDFADHALESYLHVQLICSQSGFSSMDYQVQASLSKSVLLAVAILCLILAVLGFYKEKKPSV